MPYTHYMLFPIVSIQHLVNNFSNKKTAAIVISGTGHCFFLFSCRSYETNRQHPKRHTPTQLLSLPLAVRSPAKQRLPLKSVKHLSRIKKRPLFLLLIRIATLCAIANLSRGTKVLIRDYHVCFCISHVSIGRDAFRYSLVEQVTTCVKNTKQLRPNQR